VASPARLSRRMFGLYSSKGVGGVRIQPAPSRNGIARRGRRPRRPDTRRPNATPIIPSIAMRVGDAMHRVSTGGASGTPPPTGNAVSLFPLGVGSSLRRIKGKAPALRFCLNCDLCDSFDLYDRVVRRRRTAVRLYGQCRTWRRLYR
jgi:hypothetical protein